MPDPLPQTLKPEDCFKSSKRRNDLARSLRALRNKHGITATQAEWTKARTEFLEKDAERTDQPLASPFSLEGPQADRDAKQQRAKTSKLANACANFVQAAYRCNARYLAQHEEK